MSKWILVMILGLQAHFAASYLVPLKQEDQGAIGGALRWFWPRADGDHGPEDVGNTASETSPAR